MTKLVGNLQTYKLGLTRIGKTSKGKSMALKAKSSEIDESSNDEDSKMKSYITKQFKRFMKNANGKERRMLRKVISTLFPQDLSVLGVKALGILNMSALHISRALGRVRHLLLP